MIILCKVQNIVLFCPYFHMQEFIEKFCWSCHASHSFPICASNFLCANDLYQFFVHYRIKEKVLAHKSEFHIITSRVLMTFWLLISQMCKWLIFDFRFLSFHYWKSAWFQSNIAQNIAFCEDFPEFLACSLMQWPPWWVTYIILINLSRLS